MVKSFYDKYGHIKMPADYVVEGVWLRRWLSEQVAKLESVGIRRGQHDTPKRMEAAVQTGISAS